MRLQCKQCSYQWDYDGKMRYYATCPDCHVANPIRELTKDRDRL